MAVVTGSVQTAFGFSQPTGPSELCTITTEQEVWHCFVTVTWPTGTYASAGNAEFSPATVIQNTLQNGKTVTPISCAFVSPGVENGAIVGAAGTVTASAGKFTFELTQEDLSTEHADGAMSTTWTRPLTFAVGFYCTAGNG